MAEYINKESALSVILGQPADAHYPSWYAAQIEKLKPVNVAPVVHGRWYFDDEGYCRCGNCGRKSPVFLQYDDEPISWMAYYCPNCGAKMDGTQ